MGLKYNIQNVWFYFFINLMLGLGLCHLDAHKCNACDHRF
jgi:hypothetical protein